MLDGTRMTIYFSVMVYVVLAIMFHDYSHEEGEFVYDEISMPSFFIALEALEQARFPQR
jgi:hypothetical protein